MGVNQADTVEALSIPLQQVARVTVQHNDFTNEQRELLSQIIDIEMIEEAYLPYISDPIKELIRSKGNQQYIKENKLEFIKLYLQVGLKHPITYIIAWVEQTKGFWNGGYYYWRWTDEVEPNMHGIQKVVFSEYMDKFFQDYLRLFSTNRFLQIFLCIGFYVWVDLGLYFISVVKRSKISLFLSLLILSIILSLVISTPVYAEFRYAYGILCSLPFVIVAVFHRKEGDECY